MASPLLLLALVGKGILYNIAQDNIFQGAKRLFHRNVKHKHTIRYVGSRLIYDMSNCPIYQDFYECYKCGKIFVNERRVSNDNE